MQSLLPATETQLSGYEVVGALQQGLGKVYGYEGSRLGFVLDEACDRVRRVMEETHVGLTAEEEAAEAFIQGAGMVKQRIGSGVMSASRAGYLYTETDDFPMLTKEVTSLCDERRHQLLLMVAAGIVYGRKELTEQRKPTTARESKAA